MSTPSLMHCDGPSSADQVEAATCAYCCTLFLPVRRWGAFCSAKCRNDFEADFGATGAVASVRKLRKGVSVVIHLNGPAAERALKFGIRDPVRLTRKP